MLERIGTYILHSIGLLISSEFEVTCHSFGDKKYNIQWHLGFYPMPARLSAVDANIKIKKTKTKKDTRQARGIEIGEYVENAG